MSRAIRPLPQYAFMAWCLVKAQGQLYLIFYLLLSQMYYYMYICTITHDVICNFI